MNLLDRESIVRNPAAPYHERGRTLAALIADESYKGGFGSVESYCQSLGFSGERGRQLVAAGRTYDLLQTTGAELLPETESQIRPLTTLPQDKVIEVWQYIATISPQVVPSGDLIESVVEVVRRRPDAPIQYATLDDLPEAAYPTDNDFDIPVLLPDYQATSTALPILLWGTSRRKSASAGTWHFYTDDSRYSALISDPTPVVNSGCTCAVEPNFSLYGQLPRALALGRIYHKRYLARFWQSQGIKIFVDLNVAPEYALYNLIGVPEGWRAYATHGYSDRIEDTINEYEIACYHRGARDVLFVVYGGGQVVQDTAKLYGWLWFPEYMSERRQTP